MRKRIKSRFAVIGAHAALSDPAEAHFRGSQMHDHIIDTAASEPDAVLYLGDRFLIMREYI